MQPGDLIQLPLFRGSQLGIVISEVEHLQGDWTWVLLDSNEKIMWPTVQLRAAEFQPDINELTDQQLEEVRGGMSAERFELWRMERINEV